MGGAYERILPSSAAEAGPARDTRMEAAGACPPRIGAETISCIKRVGASLLRGFIFSLFQQQGPGSLPTRPLTIEELGGHDAPDGPRVTSLRECLYQIWESLSQNPEIDSLVQCVAGQPPLQALAGISEHLFADGINWGRVVVFFYYTYRVIAQALGSYDCISFLVDWALNFLWERITPWIQLQGGWDAIFSFLHLGGARTPLLGMPSTHGTEEPLSQSLPPQQRPPQRMDGSGR